MADNIKYRFIQNVGDYFPMQNVYLPTQMIFCYITYCVSVCNFFEGYFRGTNGGQNFAYQKKEKQ